MLNQGCITCATASLQSCSTAAAGPGAPGRPARSQPSPEALEPPHHRFWYWFSIYMICHSLSFGRYKANPPTFESCFCLTRRIKANLPNLSNRFVVVLNLALDNQHSWSATDNMATKVSLLATLMLTVWGFYGEILAAQKLYGLRQPVRWVKWDPSTV